MLQAHRSRSGVCRRVDALPMRMHRRRKRAGATASALWSVRDTSTRSRRARDSPSTVACRLRPKLPAMLMSFRDDDKIRMQGIRPARMRQRLPYGRCCTYRDRSAPRRDHGGRPTATRPVRRRELDPPRASLASRAFLADRRTAGDCSALRPPARGHLDRRQGPSRRELSPDRRRRARRGRMRNGADPCRRVVMVRSDWSKRWPDAARFQPADRNSRACRSTP